MLDSINELLHFFQKQEEFNAAVQYTAGRFEFTAALIEKDYLCSLLLLYLYSNNNFFPAFKGGTLLAKTYTDFYRLSEDLDFTVSIPHHATRSQRSDKIKSFKKELEFIEHNLPIFRVESALKGSNESRQYNMELSYQSQVGPEHGKIFIEISLREELHQAVVKNNAKTLLIDPYSGLPKVSPINILSLSLPEAYAEKIRAALCRKKLAIRDYYDLDYAFNNYLITFEDKGFINLIKKKVIHEKYFHDFRDIEVVEFLRTRIDSELVPTLKQSAINMFSLERVIESLAKITSVLDKIE